jgi:hypothetical protein
LVVVEEVKIMALEDQVGEDLPELLELILPEVAEVLYVLVDLE